MFDEFGLELEVVGDPTGSMERERREGSKWNGGEWDCGCKAQEIQCINEEGGMQAREGNQCCWLNGLYYIAAWVDCARTPRVTEGHQLC